MPGLDKIKLAADIKAALDAESDKQIDPATARQNLANDIANAIDGYVKAATIKYTDGLVAPNGAVTGTFNGELE